MCHHDVFLFRLSGVDPNATPHAMQWAIRANNSQSRAAGNSAATPQPTSGTGFIYVDSSSLRRSGGNAAAASTAASSEVTGTSGALSMSNSASALARAFGIVVREVSGLGRFVFNEVHAWFRFYCHGSVLLLCITVCVNQVFLNQNQSNLTSHSE